MPGDSRKDFILATDFFYNLEQIRPTVIIVDLCWLSIADSVHKNLFAVNFLICLIYTNLSMVLSQQE